VVFKVTLVLKVIQGILVILVLKATPVILAIVVK
jgi:hypothetical protein